MQVYEFPPHFYLLLICIVVWKAEKGGSSTGLVVAIVVAIMVAVLLFIAGYCFLAKGSNKAYHISYALDGKYF